MHDFRFIMLRGSSGFYSYAIYQRDETMPAFNLNEARIAFMLNKEKYVYTIFHVYYTNFKAQNSIL